MSGCMNLKNKIGFIKIEDRKLGDEWTGWQGNIEDYEKNASTGKRIFIGVLLFALLIIGIISFVIWYLISPRLAQFYNFLPVIIGLIFLASWCILGLWFGFMVLSLITGKNYLMQIGKKQVSISFLIPVAIKFGRQLGISRDRISNSFVKVSNLLIRNKSKSVKPHELLILLPRCLHKSLIQKILETGKQFNIPVYTVAGGTSAREIVYERMPRAIIGVACERDLLLGKRECFSSRDFDLLFD